MKNRTIYTLCCAVLMGSSFGQEADRSAQKLEAMTPQEALALDHLQQAPLRAAAQQSVPGPKRRGAPQYVPTTTRPLDEVAPDGGMQMPSLSIDFSRLFWDQNADGRYWVKAESFKASFDENGLRYIPFLGSDAPQNYPLESRLESVRIAGEALALTDADKADRQGDRVTLDRGAVEVHYDVGLQGIEQSFSFASLPTHADAVLRLKTTTELTPVARGNGWRFANEIGGVDVGGAQVFDANGASMELTTSWVDGALEITVPQDFLSRAVAPILVDPLISTFTVDAIAVRDLRHPDIAYAYTNNRYCAVYEEIFSATDTDIYSRVLSGVTGANLGVDAYIEMGGGKWARPAVAYQLNDNVFMVVAEASDAGSSYIDIRGRTRNPINTSISAPFVVSFGGPAAQKRTPDIGGDVYAGSDSYFVIVHVVDFGTFSSIRTVTYFADGTVRAPYINTHVDVNKYLTRPTISQSTGILSSDPKFNVAWLSRDSTFGASHVYSQQLTYAGDLIGSRNTVAATSGSDYYFDVDVSELVNQSHASTGEPYYLVAFDSTDESNGNTLLFMYAGEDLVNFATVPFLEMRASSPDRDCTRIATTASQWIVAFGEDSGANKVDIRTLTLEPVQGTWGGVETPFRVVSDQVHASSEFNELAICSAVSGGAPASLRDAFLTWAHRVGSTPFRISGARIQTAAGISSGYLYCTGEPNSTGEQAYLVAKGGTGTTSFKGLFTTRMPANQIGYTLVGSSSANIPFAGGSDGKLCVGGSFGRYNQVGEIGFSGTTGEFSFQVNPSQIRTSGAPVAAMAGQRWHFQTWFRDTPAGSGHSNFSNAIAIPFD